MSAIHVAPSQRAANISAPIHHDSCRIEAFGLSDMGVQRTTNEDSLAVLPHLGLFMVADGMGASAAPWD